MVVTLSVSESNLCVTLDGHAISKGLFIVTGTAAPCRVNTIDNRRLLLLLLVVLALLGRSGGGGGGGGRRRGRGRGTCRR